MSSADVIPKSRRRGLWFKLLIAFVLVVFGLAGWLMVERQRGKAALKKYEQELLAKGEKLTIAELVAPIPEGKNGAVELLGLSFQDGSALMMNSPPPLRHVAPGKVLVIIKEAEWRDADGNRYTWDQVHSDLERNKEALDELRSIVRSPVLRYPISDYGIFMRLPHLAAQRRAAQWLSSSALSRTRERNIDGAIDDMESLMLLTRLGENEPVVISQILRFTFAQIAVNHLWPVLESPDARDEQLARLQTVFASVDLLSAMVPALEAVRALGRDTLNAVRQDRLSMTQLTGGGWEDDDESGVLDTVPYNEELKETLRAAIIYPVWEFAFSHADEKRFLEEMQRLIEAARSSNTNRSATYARTAAEALEVKTKRGGELSSWRFLTTQLLAGSVGKGSVRGFRAQTHCAIAVTAIALKRYHLRHETFPDRLSDLVPDFLSEIPIDYMDGQRLRYRRADDRYLLWSVGPDGKDDGGAGDSRAPFHWMRGADDVWPQPASEAEAVAYRESLMKR